MKSSNFLLAVLVLMVLAPAAFGQGGRKCLADELSLEVRSVHSDGFPGRVEASAKTLHEGEPEFTFVIPVVFHIMHNDGPELNVGAGQVQSQIDVLNEDYGRYGNGFNNHPEGIDVKIKFCLASVDPDGNPTNGIDTVRYAGTQNHDPFATGVDLAMKRLAIWDPLRYMNVYIVRSITGQTAGYAYFPEEAAGTEYDGLVIDFRQVGRSGTAVALGRTGTHEVGHYLSLLHPWGLSDTLCGARGDFCEDTPEVPFQFFSTAPTCPHPPSCGDSLRQIENYMDYSDDGCLNMFTFCQGQRMRDAISKYRYELVSSANLARTGCSDVLQGEPPLEVFTIYPNPASDVLMIYADFENDKPVDIELYDMQGRRVLFQSPAGQGRGALPVEVGTLNEGMYHLVVRMSTRYLRQTIMVAR